MSESLRNDGHIWVPAKEDAEAIRKGTMRANDIPEEDRDYYLERRYPASETSSRETLRLVLPKNVAMPVLA